MSIDLTKCAWITTDSDDWDPDGCDECEWETWKCHQAAIELAKAVLNVQDEGDTE